MRDGNGRVFCSFVRCHLLPRAVHVGLGAEINVKQQMAELDPSAHLVAKLQVAVSTTQYTCAGEKDRA